MRKRQRQHQDNKKPNRPEKQQQGAGFTRQGFGLVESEAADSGNQGNHNVRQNRHLQQFDKGITDYLEPTNVFAKKKSAKNPQQKSQQNIGGQTKAKLFFASEDIGLSALDWIEKQKIAGSNKKRSYPVTAIQNNFCTYSLHDNIEI